MKRSATMKAELMSRLPVWAFALAAAMPQLAGMAQAQQAEEEEAEILGTIVLTATGQAQALPDAPATITVISGEEIASKPYATIADVLKDVPGVIVSSPSSRSGAETISIRGLGESYVLTLVDGKPIGNSQEATYNGFGSGLAMSYLPPPSAIERIEVIRGPMSSLYGTAASGGVINVITKPVADVWSGSLTLGHTNFQKSGAGNSHEGRFYLSGPIIQDKLGLAFFGSLHDRSKPEMEVAGRGGSVSLQSQDTERKTIGSRLTWSIDATQALDFEVVSSSSDTVNQTVGGTPGGVTVDRMNYALGHKLSWGEGYETNSFVTFEDVDFENGTNISGYELLNLNTKTNLSLGRHDLTLGFDYRDETTRHSPNRVNVDPKMTRWNWALFGEDNFHLTDDLTVTFGLRYDENERYGSHITPRLYAVWHAMESLTIKGGVSGGYKTPTLKQADSNIFEPSGGDGRARDQGNTNLKPEESTNFEIGMIWESESGVQVGLTAYHTRFKNKITTEQICAHDTPVAGLPTNCGMNTATDPIKWINQYVNRDAAELNGVEATVDWTLGDVDFAFNYTYADSKVTKGNAVGSRFNNSPLHVANLGVDWQANDSLMIWANAQYRSATYDAGAGRIGEHAIFDIGLDYDFNENIMGSIAIYNVDDKTFGTTNYNDGRRFYVGLTSTF